jgi:hypothetical protein
MQATQKPASQDVEKINQGGDAPAPEVQTNRGASAGLGGQAPQMRLILENIGPIKSAEVVLGKTVLYGANNTGKTTVARALAAALRVLRGFEVEKYELESLVSRDADVGRIVLVDGGVKYSIGLQRHAGNLILSVFRNDEKIYVDEFAKGSINTHLNEHLSVEKMIWVKHDDAGLINMREGYSYVDLVGLLSFHEFLKIIDPLDAVPEEIAAETFDEYVLDVARFVSNTLQIYPSGLSGSKLIYFTDGKHFYGLGHGSRGVIRLTLIAAAIELAKKVPNTLVFIENIEDALSAPVVNAVLDKLIGSNVPVIIETHSLHVLAKAHVKKLNYYVFKSGTVTSDLKDPSLFEEERAIASQLAEIL